MTRLAQREEYRFIDKALELAIAGHKGQGDRGGAPYILHILQVMLNCHDDPRAMTVAAIHDLVENSPTTLNDLRKLGFTEDIVEAVDSLTRRDGETYEEFIERIILNPLARRVKKADLESNMNILRVERVDEAFGERLARYRSAWERIKQVEIQGRA